MLNGRMHVSSSYTKEAVAYAVGRTEEWIRQFAESASLPFSTVANGVSSALAEQGNRASMLLSQVRPEAPGASEVLQPEVEMVKRPRHRLSKATPPNGGKLTRNQIRYIRLAARKGGYGRLANLAKKYGVTRGTISYHIRRKAA